MSVLNFPDDLAVLVVDTATEVHLGDMTLANNQEIGHIVLSMIKVGVHVGDEQFRLALYTTPDRSDTPVYSDTVDVSTITSLTSSSWIGRVRFDFNRESLNTVSTYYVTLDPVTYTRTADTFYFSAQLDWPVTVNTRNTPQAGAKMELWGYR